MGVHRTPNREAEYWEASPRVQTAVLGAFARAGARAVVAEQPPAGSKQLLDAGGIAEVARGERLAREDVRLESERRFEQFAQAQIVEIIAYVALNCFANFFSQVARPDPDFAPVPLTTDDGEG